MKRPYRQNNNKVPLRDHIFIITVLVIVVAPLVYLFYAATLQLQIEAWQNARYLSGITIVQGQKTKATAQPDGDFLTGSSSPAYAEFKVNGMLEDVHRQTAANLTPLGYRTDGYADTSDTDSGSVRKVAIKMTKGTKSIVLEYNFEKSIICEYNQKPCNFDGYVDINSSGLKDTKINMIKVFYDNN